MSPLAMGDLGRRLGVAVVGIPAVLAILYLGGWFLSIPVAAIAAVGAWELGALARARDVRPLKGVAAACAATIVLSAGVASTFAELSVWFSAIALAGTGLALVLALGLRGPDGRPLAVAGVTVLALPYLGLSLGFIPLLHVLPETAGWTPGAIHPWAGTAAVAFPLAATWVADAAAYFVGSAWGRRKLAPSVSPNKTLLGAFASLLGGALAGAGWMLVVRTFLPGVPGTVAMAAAGGAALSAGGQLGDLVESVLKREAGVKDSGGLFPGHGGALDRLDALVFTFPLAYGLLVLAEGLR